MKKFLKNNRRHIFLIFLLLLGFLIRIYFVDKIIVGDLLTNGEWGQRLIQAGAREQYFSSEWKFSPPNYLPVSQYVFGSMFWLFDHKYFLPILHNVIRLPPAIFINYFYKFGYILLLKLPSILSDLGISVLIYKILMKLTGDFKKALLGFVLFLFNPITIFVSGAWGQTDSIVAFLGLLSFLWLAEDKIMFSIPTLFVGLYFKPSWIIFLPFYLFTLTIKKVAIKPVLGGIFLSLIIFLVTTIPFSGQNVFVFAWEELRTKLVFGAGDLAKASVSAFNFQTIFFRIDRDFSSSQLLGIPASVWGYISYILLNATAIAYLRKRKADLESIVSGLFIIGFGSFLFLAGMLERYFFPALAPMLILAISKPKLLISSLIINLILAANILWSFYRRGSDEIDHPFTGNNFLLIRLLSITNVVLFLAITRCLVLQFRRG